MPRAVRIQYPGATYHVLSRGNRKEAIFEDDDDRRTFIRTLAETCERTGFRVHSYVLMPNHYHLLLETPEANLVDGMRWLQGTYTARHRTRHGSVGHLLQGRYKAIPVAARAGDYFRTVSDYIHLNPLRAGLAGVSADTLTRFPWSSAKAFCDGGDLPPWLVRSRVFRALDLPDQSRSSRSKFRAYLTTRAIESLSASTRASVDRQWQDLRRGWYVGDESFRRELLSCAATATAGRQRSSFEDVAMERHDEDAAQKWLDLALRAASLDLATLRGLKQNDPRKQLVAWAIRTRTRVTSAWILDRLAMGDASNIRRATLAYRSLSDTPRQKLARAFLHICRD